MPTGPILVRLRTLNWTVAPSKVAMKIGKTGQSASLQCSGSLGTVGVCDILLSLNVERNMGLDLKMLG